ncbi:SPOR domain-containing protein [Kushneria phosphatilytica]|nr:SPOR domain-containing protein [Kushneria phosphatilytica]
MTIEQPIDVQREDVPPPTSPIDEDSTADRGQSIERPSPDEVSSGQGQNTGNPQASQTSQLLPDSSRNDRPAASSDNRGESKQSDSSSRPATADTGSSNRNESATDTASDAARSASSGQQQNARDNDPIMNAANRGSSGSGDWAVQAGSFGKADNADRLVARLKDLGFHAYQKSRKDLQTVYVGPYDSSEAGEQARTQLQQRANIKGLVVRRDEQ